MGCWRLLVLGWSSREFRKLARAGLYGGRPNPLERRTPSGTCH